VILVVLFMFGTGLDSRLRGNDGGRLLVFCYLLFDVSYLLSGGEEGISMMVVGVL